MKQQPINKNRFRNFCVGISLACLFVLWAFNITKVKKENIAEIYYPPEKPWIEISSFTPPEELVEIPEKQKELQKAEPLVENALLTLVEDFKMLKIIDRTPTISMHKVPVMMPVVQTVLPNPIEMSPDILPSFPGGADALKSYLESNVRYPENCLGSNRSGLVAVRFVVDEDGNISDAVVVKDELQCTAGYEAIRVMKTMPKWNPGRKNGKAVKSYFVQVFRFQTL